MFEKIFGKKSTGIVYTVSVCLLLLLLGAAVWIFCLRGDLGDLVCYAVYIAVAAVLMTVPAAVQKKFRLYIPPAVQISLCIYAVVYFSNIFVLHFSFNSPYTAAYTTRVVLSPAVGGFCMAIAVFSIAFSLADGFAAKRGKSANTLAVTACALSASMLLEFLFSLLIGLVALAFMGEVDFTPYMQNAMLDVTGCGVCAIYWIICRLLHRWEKFRIVPFDRGEAAQGEEVARNRRRVIEKLRADDTDYRRVFGKAKAWFLFVRIVWLLFYGAYLGVTAVAYARSGLTVGYILIGATCVSYALMCAAYVYEYSLFRRGVRSRGLRKLKIVKSCVRVYTLLLVLTAMFFADVTLNRLSAVFSVVMVIVNLCSLFYNAFAKPQNACPKPAGRGEGEPLEQKKEPTESPSARDMTE